MNRQLSVSLFILFRLQMSSKTFALVRWIDEESIGVMPVSAAVNKDDVYVGSVTKMKWVRGKKAVRGGSSEDIWYVCVRRRDMDY